MHALFFDQINHLVGRPTTENLYSCTKFNKTIRQLIIKGNFLEFKISIFFMLLGVSWDYVTKYVFILESYYEIQALFKIILIYYKVT